MTEQEIRIQVVRTFQSFLGCRESDGSHQRILDIYNAHIPLARGYKVRASDSWCAATVSAVAIQCGLTDIMPTECSCGRMIALYRGLGRWEESNLYEAQPGDVIFYDWSGGDGWPDHVGVVTARNGTKLTVIEGNISDAVGYRTISLGDKRIRGFGLPDYGSKATTTTTKEVCNVELPVLKKGSAGGSVKALQILLIGYGYSCGSYGADGEFGSATDAAVRKFQTDKGLIVDGVVGSKTWGALVGIS